MRTIEPGRIFSGTSHSVLGAGYRLTSSIRAGGGALVFLESDPNPLITAKEVATTWYVSFSFDVDVGRIFR